MTQYSVFDKTVKQGETFFAVTPAKKWMRERMKLSHEVSGSKVKIYGNGNWVNCGAISITGSNKAFVANTRMTKDGY